MHRLTPGFVLASRYRLQERAAAGGMGEVWGATDLVLERKVALKVLHPQALEQEAVTDRFRAEAKYAAQLSHPNIVEVFDFGVHDGLTFLVMEFIEGPTLTQLLEAEGPLAPDRVRTILLQLAGALARAHENGIIHRDLKPANVIVSPDGFAKLMDFGIAKDVDGQSHTVPGEILGTTHYISPEQALGEVVTPRSDLYSLGVLAHELLTGAKPFDRGTPIATALAHVADPPPPLPPEVPPDLAAVVTACLAKDPGDRPVSAAELAGLLTVGDEASVPLVLAEHPQVAPAGIVLPHQPVPGADPPPTERWQPAWPAAAG
ncbi:MAG: serine/threonine protein kinase [Propionibacteriaceae bacterium]|nr:serine/threonine protein kinase [Propionibacteriaceae bacterium]